MEIMDGTRISTGEMVAMKRIKTTVHTYEAEIGEYFSRVDIATDPRNHCIPIYDVLTVPDKSHEIILVMPLFRPFENPPFRTVGEVVDFLTQIFEVCLYLSPVLMDFKHCLLRDYTSCMSI